MHSSNQDSTQGQPKTIRSGLAFALALFMAVFTSLLIAPGANGLLGAYLATLMIAIALNDARHYLIPNELTAAAFDLPCYTRWRARLSSREMELSRAKQ
ncbi:hypothetical protein [Bradyrhizobium sp. McL0616]|uniref:hypothetical protein n=1 Tax=Bradyrhizobium sp. McL0616 TaxID=3415674 RepID=UPI003CF5ACD4